MTLNKSVYLNTAEAPYLNADWKVRSVLVSHLRSVEGDVRRLLDLGNLTNTLSENENSKLAGIAMAVGFVAEAFDNVNKPVREVRERIKTQKNDTEEQLLTYRKANKVKSETEYLVTAIRVLEKILEVTEGMEANEYQLMGRV